MGITSRSSAVRIGSGSNAVPGHVHLADGTTGGGGVADHGDLSGLENDDHPQYLRPVEVIGGPGVIVDLDSQPGKVVLSGISTTFQQVTLSRPGVLFVSTGRARWYAPGAPGGPAITIKSVRCSVGTAPVGGVIEVVVKSSGFSTLVTIPNGAQTSGREVMYIGSVNPDEFFTVDVLKVGSSVPGSDLTVQIEYA